LTGFRALLEQFTIFSQIPLDHAYDEVGRHLLELVAAANGSPDDFSHAQEDIVWIERNKTLQSLKKVVGSAGEAEIG